MIFRILKYFTKRFKLDPRIKEIKDSRIKPRIQTYVVIYSIFILYIARFRSLNQFEEDKNTNFWSKLLIKSKIVGKEDKIPSVDSIGRISCGVSINDLLITQKELFLKLKRQKVFKGMGMGIIDGHEVTKSNHRKCPYCLTRKINTKHGEKTEYYHKYSYFLLVYGKYKLLLDIEPVLPGEGEVTASKRLLKRVCKNYGRSFDILLADALYLGTDFVRIIEKNNKHFIIVLKDKRRELYQDAMGLRKILSPEKYEELNKKFKVWDIEDLSSWEMYGKKIRVVISKETTKKRRHSSDYLETGKKWEEKTDTNYWAWATNIKKKDCSTKLFVSLAHTRWKIENEGFNEMVTFWNGNHIFKHDQNSIIVFFLILFTAQMVFHVFFHRNLKNSGLKKSKLRILNMIHSSLMALIDEKPKLEPG